MRYSQLPLAAAIFYSFNIGRCYTTQYVFMHEVYRPIHNMQYSNVMVIHFSGPMSHAAVIFSVNRYETFEGNLANKDLSMNCQ